MMLFEGVYKKMLRVAIISLLFLKDQLRIRTFLFKELLSVIEGN
jgi:hypothetical protein